MFSLAETEGWIRDRGCFVIVGGDVDQQSKAAWRLGPSSCCCRGIAHAPRTTSNAGINLGPIAVGDQDNVVLVTTERPRPSRTPRAASLFSGSLPLSFLWPTFSFAHRRSIVQLLLQLFSLHQFLLQGAYSHLRNASPKHRTHTILHARRHERKALCQLPERYGSPCTSCTPVTFRPLSHLPAREGGHNGARDDDR